MTMPRPSPPSAGNQLSSSDDDDASSSVAAVGWTDWTPPQWMIPQNLICQGLPSCRHRLTWTCCGGRISTHPHLRHRLLLLLLPSTPAPPALPYLRHRLLPPAHGPIGKAGVEVLVVVVVAVATDLILPRCSACVRPR